MKRIIAVIAVLASSGQAMTPPQTIPLQLGKTVTPTERDTLTLEGSKYQWKRGENSLCPSITDPGNPIDCVRMGSLELVFTQTKANKKTSFTLTYGDDGKLTRKLGKYTLKVLKVEFPKRNPESTSCPEEVHLHVTLEKAN